MPNTLSRVSAPHLSGRSRNRHRAGTRNRCPSTAQYIPLPIHCQYGGMPLIPVIRANLGGPRLHGNDDGRRRCTSEAAGAPTSSFPQRREGGDGFPSPREREGGDGDDGHPHRHSRDSGRAGMGSRLHGDGSRTRRSSFPRTAGPGGWVPRLHGNAGDGGHPSPFPRGGNPRRHSRDEAGGGPIHGGGIRGGGPGDGFPSPRERRGHPHRHSRDPAGIHGGEGPGMGSRLHGNDGGQPRWAEAAATTVIQRVSTGTTVGSTRELRWAV